MATLISTPSDLDSIRNDLAGTYELINDIDMSSFADWTPIDNFAGTLDGKGFKILNLSVNLDGGYGGLIGNTASTFTVNNLGFENVDINTTGYNAGTLVGYTGGIGTVIDNCFVEGGTIQADGYAGGLVGNFRGEVTLTNSYAILDRIYTTTYRSSGFIGAFVGDNHLVENCYSVTYDLSSADSNEVFGFAWYENNSTVKNCFWDKEVSGVTTSHHGVGKTTSEMQTESTYTNWDFTTVWGMNGGYPYLQVFGVPEAPAKVETINVTSYSLPIETLVSSSKKTNKQTNTFVNTLHTQNKRSVATLRSVEGYTSSIYTDVSKSVRSVKSGNKNVVSYLKPINSSLDKHARTIKQLESHVKHIQANVGVQLPYNGLLANATLSIITNPSNGSQMASQSNVSTIKNPSLVEVMR